MKDVDLSLPAKSSPPESIREHTDNLIKALNCIKSMGYINNKIYHLLQMACEYHDYGKVNKYFQERIRTGGKFNAKEEIPHNVLSVFFIDEKIFISKDDYYIVMNAVLNHHSYGNNLETLERRTTEAEDILSDYIHFSIKRRTIGKINDIKGNNDAIITKGLLHKCDYAASAGIEVEYKNDFLISSMESLNERWKKSGTSSGWNDLQLFCSENINENIVVTAPTGMGKTEASLLWLGNNKGFYILPLKTAINSIFKRISEDILENIGTDKRVALLHSDSISFITNDQSYDELDLFEYVSRGRKLSLPITVSTPDQIFDFVFRYPSYELKLATLSYSKIIIDEIQAYSSDILAYLIYGIHRIIDVGGRFSIFTATLPPFILTLLNEPYKGVLPYKCGDFSKDLELKIRHNIKVVNDELSAEYVYNRFLKMDEKGSRKLLIVCNTVKKAQELYENLKTLTDYTIVKILHSKYIRSDRRKKEIAILSDGETFLSDKKTINSKTVIWVSTQIVEASLDIDFDYVFTELSDLNGLFQRLGRCNRKGIKSAEKYNCFVFLKINEKLLTDKNSDRGFIDRDIFRLSQEALENIDGKITEEKKSSLIKEYFDFQRIKDSKFIDEYKKKYKYLKELYINENSIEEVNRKFRNIISKSVIPENIYNDKIKQICEAENTLKIKFSTDESDRNEFLRRKQMARDIILDCSVSVANYEYDPKMIIKSIRLNRNESIPVIKCIYDEMGFRKMNREKYNDRDNKNSDSAIIL